jgi:ATP-binding cassette, subfamily B, bacterial MsbA
VKFYQRLLRYLRPYWAKLALALVSMAGVSGLTALMPYLIKPILDKVFIARDVHILYKYLALLPVLGIGKGILSYWQNYLMAFIGLRAVTDLRKQLFDHMQGLSIDFFGSRPTGKTMAIFTNDLAALQQVIARTPIYLVRDGLTAIGLVGFLFYLSWKFTLLTLTLLPASAAIIWALGKTLRRIGRKTQTQMGELYYVIQENIQAAPVVKAYGAEAMESARFQKTNEHFMELALRLAKTDTISSPAMEMIGILIAAMLVWRGGLDVINGVWSTGSFFAFIACAWSTYRPLKNFAELNAQLQLGLASSERIFELLDQVSSIQEAPVPVILPPLSRSLQYDNVSFRYRAQETTSTESRWAVEAVNLTIRAGEIVALVGPSGAGKTTLALLLPRFYDPTLGRVRLDGHDIREATLRSLRQQIGLVTQEVLLFNETVRYNIAFGKPDASLAEIQAAAESANAHEFVKRLPQGYDTVIGERGMRVSGGERQRLSIARALLKNPPILILDEATSSLDAESERLVQEAVERLMAHRTVMVIAHRLATVRKADRIVVLDRGQIAEEGDHQSLLARGGTYHRLHSLQILQ